MSKLTRWLLVLLAAQLIVAVIIYMAGVSNDVNYKPAPLIALDKSQITKLVIVDGENETTESNDDNEKSHSSDENKNADKNENADENVNSRQAEKSNQVVMVKEGSDWKLPQLNQLPANQAKLDLAIGKLMGLQTSWPIATSEEAQQRFQVSEAKFKKKVQFFNGKNLLAELLLGTSPGFKKIHIRRADNNEIYSLELNGYDFPVDANDWLNQALLQVNNITRLTFEQFVFERNDEKWEIIPKGKLPKGKHLDDKKIEAFADKLINLTVTGVASSAPTGSNEKAVALSIFAEQDYIYYLQKNENKHWIKRGDIDSWFEISASTYQSLSKISLDNFLSEAAQNQDEQGENQQAKTEENLSLDEQENENTDKTD